jgi:hypothetical protein
MLSRYSTVRWRTEHRDSNSDAGTLLITMTYASRAAALFLLAVRAGQAVPQIELSGLAVDRPATGFQQRAFRKSAA